jgi:hypothetical protein
MDYVGRASIFGILALDAPISLMNRMICLDGICWDGKIVPFLWMAEYSVQLSFVNK